MSIRENIYYDFVSTHKTIIYCTVHKTLTHISSAFLNLKAKDIHPIKDN